MPDEKAPRIRENYALNQSGINPQDYRNRILTIEGGVREY